MEQNTSPSPPREPNTSQTQSEDGGVSFEEKTVGRTCFPQMRRVFTACGTRRNDPQLQADGELTSSGSSLPEATPRTPRGRMRAAAGSRQQGPELGRLWLCVPTWQECPRCTNCRMQGHFPWRQTCPSRGAGDFLETPGQVGRAVHSGNSRDSGLNGKWDRTRRNS